VAQALAVVVGLTVGAPRVAWAAPVEEGPAEAAKPEPEPDTKPQSDAQSDAEPEPEPDADTDTDSDADAEPDAASEPEPEPDAETEPDAEPDAEPEPTSEPEPKPKAPAPTVGIPTIAVAVGLSPEAPGAKEEIALLGALEKSATASPSPTTKVRRLSIGSGTGRRVCRQRRDDLVILVGYVPGRERPVLLAHDCRLDTPLSVRAEAAASEPGLVGALWDEREELVRGGMRERRTISKLSPRVRGGIIAGAAIAVVGTAIGLLVANALRKERVVVTVSP